MINKRGGGGEEREGEGERKRWTVRGRGKGIPSNGHYDRTGLDGLGERVRTVGIREHAFHAQLSACRDVRRKYNGIIRHHHFFLAEGVVYKCLVRVG